MEIWRGNNSTNNCAVHLIYWIYLSIDHANKHWRSAPQEGCAVLRAEEFSQGNWGSTFSLSFLTEQWPKINFKSKSLTVTTGSTWFAISDWHSASTHCCAGFCSYLLSVPSDLLVAIPCSLLNIVNYHHGSIVPWICHYLFDWSHGDWYWFFSSNLLAMANNASINTVHTTFHTGVRI